MAASSSSDVQNGCQQEFDVWLSSHLRELGLDEDVFGSYVSGILDSEDSTDEDRKDALIGVLDGMTDFPLDDLCNEIFDKWKASRAEVLKTRVLVKEQKAVEKQNKLAEIMEKQASTVSTAKPGQAKSDIEMKKLLVAQYGHESDEDHPSNSDHEETCATESASLSGISKNINALAVADREKEKRDKMRDENEQRKQLIKEAKEKQKQKAEERKEKEKKRTQKGERRAK